MEHIDTKSSLDFKLQIGHIRCIETCSRSWNVLACTAREDKSLILESIHEILSAYSAMSKCNLAEEIIRQNLCRPFMQQKLESGSIDNLEVIFNALLDFVPSYLKHIQLLVTGKYKKLPPICGFDFISHAVFPEIVSALHVSIL